MRSLKGIVIHRGEIADSNSEYHYLVHKDSSVVQLNPDYKVAPHAKDWNGVTLGICVFGDFASSEPGRNWTPGPAQVAAVVKLCKDLRSKYGDLWIKGHSELGPSGTAIPEKLVAGHTCPGERFPLDEVRAAVLASTDEALGNNKL